MPLGDFLNSALGFRVKQHRLQYSILAELALSLTM